MTFHEQLNDYINRINCSAKELAAASELSEATLSRYRSGERVPETGSNILTRLAAGISILSTEKNGEALSETEVMHDLTVALENTRPDLAWNSANFNTLMSELNINMTELARFLNFDASYLSRVRSGQRIPAAPDTFAANVALYLARHASDGVSLETLSEILKCPSTLLTTEEECIQEIIRFLSIVKKQEENPAKSFLTKLNEFDLNSYIRAIKFDELKVPTVPFQLITSKTYFGLEAIKDAEIDFLKSTVLAKNMEPVFMCSDLPMQDMSEDEAFAKKWMFGLAMMLKKGLHINIIHNLDRPFYELMLGLEAWIPMYMTGQVHPYYMEEKHNRLYCHLNYCSGQVALSGECISGYHADSKYYISRQKEEVEYQKKKCSQILKSAKPLMEIYTRNEASAFREKIKELRKLLEPQHDKLNSLPLFTMEKDLLERILNHNNLSEDEKKQICDYYEESKDTYAEILSNRCVSQEIIYISQEEFSSYPIHLDISGTFIEKPVLYSYEEYCEHLEQLNKYSQSQNNYDYRLSEDNSFRNIQLHSITGKVIVMSKNTAPAIHFVIWHPTLIHALENFSVPIKD